MCVIPFSASQVSDIPMQIRTKTEISPPESPEEPLSVRVRYAVVHHFALEYSILRLGRQRAINEQISGFEEVRVESQLLDWVASGSTGPFSHYYSRCGPLRGEQCSPVAQHWVTTDQS